MSDKKAIIYYSDNQLNMRLAATCRKYLIKTGLPVTSVTLKPTNFGRNIVVKAERSYETMFTQILTGLEAMTEDIIYFAEHDTLYHPSHFEFTPSNPEVFYYNGNYWFIRMTDGFAVHYNVSPLSGLVAYREPLVTHFRERLELIKKEGFSYNIGFEPMTHKRIKWEHWYNFEIFNPPFPNVDLCHGANLTQKRWSTDKFRRKPTFWEESDINNIPGWEDLPKIIEPFFPQKLETKVEKPVKETPIKVVEEINKTDIEDSLDILIPARNEMFLARTIEDILKNKRKENTRILVGCDGSWPDPRIPDHKNVIMVHYSESIGQRAMTNRLASLSNAKYLMKTDAHCAFDEGFDVKLMADMQDDWTTVPIMRNLHVFNWICPDGHTRYQGPSGPCKECGKETTMDVVWIPKVSPQSKSYCFDSEPHFQYFGQFSKRKEGKGELTETMSLQGSCWMLTRDKYWELNICDEKFGTWGSQGIEVAVKTHLSGGRVIVNQRTWYAHMFRTQGGDFGFPYSLSGRQVSHAKELAKELFFENKWPKQTKPLSWLLEKFWPIPGWTDEQLELAKRKGEEFYKGK